EYNTYFKDRIVVIVPDNDKPGREHAQQVARELLGVALCIKILELRGLPPKGDVSDWLGAAGTKDQLLKAIDEAKAIGSADCEAPEKTLAVKLSTVRAEDVRWLWKGRIPYGKPTILDGDPGLGKSTLTLEIAARVSRGEPMPGDEARLEPAGVVILSAEDGLAD